jgi:hypothetical protein
MEKEEEAEEKEEEEGVFKARYEWVDAWCDCATGDLRSARRSRTVGGGCIPNSKDACILRL